MDDQINEDQIIANAEDATPPAAPAPAPLPQVTAPAGDGSHARQVERSIKASTEKVRALELELAELRESVSRGFLLIAGLVEAQGYKKIASELRDNAEDAGDQ
jgi:hypothetical protein